MYVLLKNNYDDLLVARYDRFFVKVNNYILYFCSLSDKLYVRITIRYILKMIYEVNEK